MSDDVRYGDRIEPIRSALLRCAEAGGTTTYAELGKLVDIPTRGPWRPVLDLLSRQETDEGRPDITYLIVNRRTGFSSRIQFKDAKRPTAEQIAMSHAVQRAAWAIYGGRADPL